MLQQILFIVDQLLQFHPLFFLDLLSYETLNQGHQCLCHSYDQSLNNACCSQFILGLPSHPFPTQQHPCIICTITTFSHSPKAKETSINLTKYGHQLHVDFPFWNVVSIHGFSSLLSIIDGKECQLWNFPTARNIYPYKMLITFLPCFRKKALHQLLSALMRMELLFRALNLLIFLVYIT